VRCFGHQLSGMINIHNIYRKCKTPECPSVGNDKYEKLCLHCFMHEFPDKPVTYNYKTKERSVVEYVYSFFPIDQYKWFADKKVNGGQSLFRPDLKLDLGDQVLIIEVDENQHESYNCECENVRLMTLSQDLGHKPVIFIRFNPDAYYIGTQKYPSCWKFNGHGICVIGNKKEWKIRLNNLKEQIEYWIDPINKTEKIVEVIHLYYDNFTINL
jgi:hypothetical protein